MSTYCTRRLRTKFALVRSMIILFVRGFSTHTCLSKRFHVKFVALHTTVNVCTFFVPEMTADHFQSIYNECRRIVQCPKHIQSIFSLFSPISQLQAYLAKHDVSTLARNAHIFWCPKTEACAPKLTTCRIDTLVAMVGLFIRLKKGDKEVCECRRKIGVVTEVYIKTTGADY